DRRDPGPATRPRAGARGRRVARGARLAGGRALAHRAHGAPRPARRAAHGGRADPSRRRPRLMPGALEHLRVVEVGDLVAAPYATKLLADLGADVVKIEPPGHGDLARRRGPFARGVPPPQKSGLFL